MMLAIYLHTLKRWSLMSWTWKTALHSNSPKLPEFWKERNKTKISSHKTVNKSTYMVRRHLYLQTVQQRKCSKRGKWESGPLSCPRHQKWLHSIDKTNVVTLCYHFQKPLMTFKWSRYLAATGLLDLVAFRTQFWVISDGAFFSSIYAA